MKPRRKSARRWARNACLGVIAMLCLAACASAPAPGTLTKVQVERVTVPPALLIVAAEPAVPASRMQSAAADYIARLKNNDDACHLDVGAIAATQQ